MFEGRDRLFQGLRLYIGEHDPHACLGEGTAHGEAEAINEEKIADNILNVLPSEVIHQPSQREHRRCCRSPAWGHSGTRRG